MKQLTIWAFALVFLSSCSTNDFEPYYNLNGETGDIHIICDARKGGTVKPWLIELGSSGANSLDLRSTKEILAPKIAQFELSDTTRVNKVSYLGGMPLIEADSLFEIMPSYGLPDTSYKHYMFTVNDKLLNKLLFKFSEPGAVKEGNIKTSRKNVTVILSTNDSILPIAIQRCNAFLMDSMKESSFFKLTFKIQ